MKKIVNYLLHPRLIIIYLMNLGCFKYISDKKFLEIKYRLVMGKKLNLDNPKKFSEKIQWLKLYDRKDIYTTMVDKYESKEYLKKYIDEQYFVKTLGIYNKYSEIDFSKLPNKFIIKCTHDSGGTFIFDEKSDENIKRAKKIINKYMYRKYFYIHREWPYKNVKPRIIIEELLNNKNNEPLLEYNFFCINGKPKFISVCFGRKDNHRYNDYYDMNFNKMKLKCIYDVSNIKLKKPKQFEQMLKISKIVSKNIPQLRVDFYICNDRVYIGELTFYHWAGFTKFEPEIYDKKFGKLIVLPKKNRK